MDTETTDLDDCDDETYLAGRAEKYGQPNVPAELSPWTNGLPPMSRRFALKLLGEVLYAARLPDGLIKFGWTADLYVRLTHLDHPQILAFRHGTRADEAVLHRSLAAHVHHGREWYKPTPEVMAVVNDWRIALGLSEAA